MPSPQSPYGLSSAQRGALPGGSSLDSGPSTLALRQAGHWLVGASGPQGWKPRPRAGCEDPRARRPLPAAAPPRTPMSAVLKLPFPEPPLPARLLGDPPAQARARSLSQPLLDTLNRQRGLRPGAEGPRPPSSNFTGTRGAKTKFPREVRPYLGCLDLCQVVP